MNILYLINYAGAAGTEKYVENLMAAASREGHRCHLAYCVPGLLSEKIQQAGYPVLQLDMRPHKVLTAAGILADYCRKQGVELIHAQYPRENVIALLAKGRNPALKVVFTSHLTVRQGRAWNYVNHALSPRNHCILSVCQQGVDILRENGMCPEKIRVIPNGIRAGAEPVRRNIIREEFGLSEETFVFITLARYAPEKGLGWLLEVLSRLKELSARPFVCVIVGDGDEFEDIGIKIQERGMADRVIRTGYRRDAAELLSSSDAYVSTALYNEAMSFAILEAMGCALPLAVTDVGAGRELADGCGFVASPGDTETMARHLQTLLEDGSLYRRLGQAAREKVCRDYDLDALLQQTLESYL